MLETAKNVLPYPSRYILSQHPHAHPSEWVPRGHRGRQNRQHSQNGSKSHKLHKRSSHSAPHKPHGVGTRTHFFGSKSKKNQKIHHFRHEKGGDHFLTRPPTASKAPKSGFQVGGGGVRGGPDQKLIWGMPLLDTIIILQGVKLTMQPLGVGYANRPNKAPNAGYVAFSTLYACLALTNNLCEVILLPSASPPHGESTPSNAHTKREKPT